MGDVNRYILDENSLMGGMDMFEDDNGDYVLHSDYATLLARHNALEEIASEQSATILRLHEEHNALVEAVAWERECEDFDRWADAMCRAWSCEWDDVVHAARADVDRLIADCKVEG